MTTTCAWCTPLPPTEPGTASHSICPSCEAKMLKEAGITTLPPNDPSYQGRVTVLTSGRPATLLRPRVRYRSNGEAIPEWEVRLHADGRVFRVRATEAMRGLVPAAGTS